MRLDGKSIGIGLLIGAAVGALVGLLTAPRSGSETRGIIWEKAGEAKDRVQGMFSRKKSNSNSEE